MSILTRKKFIINSIVGVSGMVVLPQMSTAQQTQPPAEKKRLPTLDKELVKDFVTVAHKDFDKVKSMLRDNPDLLNASHNWNDWDWEDAIGAAGHMGLRDMAMYLLEQGARPTICVAAMLGNLDVVKTFINAFPQMKETVGPHNISLMAHALQGGEPAKPIVEYLRSVGIKG